MRIGRLLYGIGLAVFSTLPLQAAGRVERTGPFTGAAPAWIKQALEPQGYRVRLADGTVAGDVWLRKDAPGLEPSAFVGVISFPAETTDFRGQKVKAGSYSMRYAPMPSDGNHMGAAPSNDFLLLVPLADDTEPAEGMPFARLATMSARTVGSNHPSALYLSDASGQKEFPAVATNSFGHEVFFVKLDKADGTALPIGLVVKGRTEHEV